MSARNRELLALIPVALLVTAGFTSVLLVDTLDVGNATLTYGGYFLAICVADPRPDPDPASARRPVPVPARRAAGRDRAGGAVPDRREPRRRAGAPVRPRCRPVRGDDRLPARPRRARALPLPDRDRGDHPARSAPGARGSARRPTSAFLSVDSGPLSFQPAELGKICIVVFLASYLREQAGGADRRRPPGARGDAAAAQALRPSAGGLGGDDGDARLLSATWAAR